MSLLIPIDNSSSKNSNILQQGVSRIPWKHFKILHFTQRGYQGEGNMKRLNGSIQATALSNQAQKEKKTFHSCIQLYFFVVSIQSKEMYCDLNIPCSAQADRSAIDKLKLILSRLTQRKLLVYLQTKKKQRLTINLASE